MELADTVIVAKQRLVAERVRTGIRNISNSTGSLLKQRLHDIDDQIADIQSLSSNNSTVVDNLTEKIHDNKINLNDFLSGFHTVRAIFVRGADKLHRELSLSKLEHTITRTNCDSSICLTTSGLRKPMKMYFTKINQRMDKAVELSFQINGLLDGVYINFLRRYQLENLTAAHLSLLSHQSDLKKLTDQHQHFLDGLPSLLTSQMKLVKKFYDTAIISSRDIFESANIEMEQWFKLALSPLEALAREHQTQLRRRLESIKRIHQARDTLEARLAELKLFKSNADADLKNFNSMSGVIEHAHTADRACA